MTGKRIVARAVQRPRYLTSLITIRALIFLLRKLFFEFKDRENQLGVKKKVRHRPVATTLQFMRSPCCLSLKNRSIIFTRASTITRNYLHSSNVLYESFFKLQFIHF